jgi:3-dehydroquinate synthase
VDLPDKSYEVVIEPAGRFRLPEWLPQVWPQARQVLVVTDSNVGPLHATALTQLIQQVGLTVKVVTVPAGEASKSFECVSHLISEMAAAGFTRQDGVIALGGGVVGDLAGLAASLYMRGIGFVQVATSLTAMVDSSVGGKTAVNLGPTKNIAGTFYQPDLVIVDPTYLTTLTDRDLLEGYAEVVKTSTLAGGDFFTLTGTIKHADDVRRQALNLVAQSIGYKAAVVITDEKETGERKFLNFGHTFGHAIELLAHGDLRHGEAVAIGMVQISKRFEAIGVSASGVTAAIQERLEAVGLPVTSNLIGTAPFFDQLVHDKKNAAGTLQTVALARIGQPVIVPMLLNEMPGFVASV